MADHESEFDEGQKIISESESQIFIIKNCEVEMKQDLNNPEEIEIPVDFELFSHENINEDELTLRYQIKVAPCLFIL